MHRGHLGRAERLAIRYLRKHPQDSTSWEVWGEVLRAREQHADEARILRRGLDFTGAPRLRFRLAQILASSGEVEAARALLESFGREHVTSLLAPSPFALATVEVDH
jgi:predicted Zn-dependent protease